MLCSRISWRLRTLLLLICFKLLPFHAKFLSCDSRSEGALVPGKIPKKKVGFLMFKVGVFQIWWSDNLTSLWKMTGEKVKTSVISKHPTPCLNRPLHEKKHFFLDKKSGTFRPRVIYISSSRELFEIQWKNLGNDPKTVFHGIGVLGTEVWLSLRPWKKYGLHSYLSFI